MNPCTRCGSTHPGGISTCPACQGSASARVAGGWALEDLGRREDLVGRALSGLPARGQQHVFEMRLRGGDVIRLAYVEWWHGECEVRRTRGLETSLRLDRQLGDVRLPVDPWGRDHREVDLEVPVREAPCSPAAYPEPDPRALAHLRNVLLAAGALTVGTRQEVLGATDERRHTWCATFPRAALRVPVVAYALVCVVPHLPPAVVSG